MVKVVIEYLAPYQVKNKDGSLGAMVLKLFIDYSNLPIIPQKYTYYLGRELIE
jgi:hypothetical protein